MGAPVFAESLDGIAVLAGPTAGYLYGFVLTAFVAAGWLAERGLDHNLFTAALPIDDLGTGSSSLSYLRRFPADAPKADKFFVGKLGLEAEDAAMMRLAKTLGIKVVAEGVETEG